MADLLTPEEVGSFVGTSGELNNPALVQQYIDAVTEVIESLTAPMAEVDRTVVRTGGNPVISLPWPFSAVVSIVENGSTLTTDDYFADGAAGLIYRGSRISPYRWGYGSNNVTVTVSVGVEVIPGAVKLAALELFRHFWQTRQGPKPGFGLPGPSASDETVYTASGYAVPHRVAELLLTYPSFPGFA